MSNDKTSDKDTCPEVPELTRYVMIFVIMLLIIMLCLQVYCCFKPCNCSSKL